MEEEKWEKSAEQSGRATMVEVQNKLPSSLVVVAFSSQQQGSSELATGQWQMMAPTNRPIRYFSHQSLERRCRAVDMCKAKGLNQIKSNTMPR